MSEKEAAQLTLADLFQTGSDRQFADVIVRATMLEKFLIILLEGKMENLSGNLRGDLLDRHNAPLATFAAKIDMAYALGAISLDQRVLLHHARKIRNVFAHAETNIHFDHADFQQDKSLRGNPLAKSELAFHEETARFMTSMMPAIENVFLIKAIRQHSTERKRKAKP
ncbi:hypothetical protein [Rhizobium mongolense]